MTAPAPPILSASVSVASSAPTARPALGAVVFTEARCPHCRKLVMAIPGHVLIEVRIVATNEERSGRGRVVKCTRGGCKTLCEVIERHG